MKENIFDWRRRRFVGSAAAAAVMSLYAAAIGRGALKACNYEDVEAGLPLDFQSLIRIGNSYLNEHSKNGELTASNELFLDQEPSSANIISAVQRRLSTIDREVRQEFERSETVICDGWVLAKSEARLCAAIAAHVRRL